MSTQISLVSLVKTFRSFNSKLFSRIGFSKSQKVVLLSVTASIALLALFARYVRRRKTTSGTSYRKLPRSPQILHDSDGDGGSSYRRIASPGLRSLRRQGSLLSGFSDRTSTAGSVTLSAASHGGGDADNAACTQPVTPQQFGVMGMEALELSIKYWEDALDTYRNTAGNSGALALTGEEEAEFYRDLERVLDAAYQLQGQCELLFLDQRSVLFRAESVSTRLGGSDLHTDYSSPESFVSAQDEVADLREFEEFTDLLTDVEKLPLYQSALKQFDENGIPYRVLRTEMVHCSSDVEYLGKLHCIRLAFQWLFRDQASWNWFADSGRQVLTDLMIFADKDPKDFLIAYEEMLKFLKDEVSWSDIELELSAKGVKALTFFDIVMDYILMDAFEDLESPPPTVTAVVQNRWLSNGFKESALTTAVWSVLKTKKSMLKYPKGFMAHFYAISAQMSPLMAWGFLGPDEKLKDMCLYFKDQVLGYLKEIFSFQQTRYASVEELSTDILSHAKTRFANITYKLSSESQQMYKANKAQGATNN
ncbi:mitoguardin [Nilaparvata lugens]|uniref:mitoguardin n=1 Tax=Nilaparvata lugens TaxID=108931 RepID=UPI00193E5AFE|nr:mitoguardin [Nilaparvata lugens]